MHAVLYYYAVLSFALICLQLQVSVSPRSLEFQLMESSLLTVLCFARSDLQARTSSPGLQAQQWRRPCLVPKSFRNGSIFVFI